MTNAQLSALADHDRETVEVWLVDFEQSWTEHALGEWVASRLPAPGHPLRRPTLAEMVKVDLERQWQQGRRLTLGSYLERFPELGTAQTVPADLLLAEYQVRQQFGAPTDLSEYTRRYPRQADELAQLVHKAEAERDTSRLAATETAFAAPAVESPPGARRGSPPDPAETADHRARRGSPDPAETADRQVSPQAQPSPLDPPARSGDRPEQTLPETFGRYRILKKLGQGGMGAVYLALDTHLQRQVALKVPNFSDREQREIVERFLREARAAATIQHPNLCPVYDAGEIQGVPYMTMAYIEGHLLSAYVKSDKPATERRAALLVRKLALALHEAHIRGIVHRDLKPTNIILNQRGEPVVMDFGLARRGSSGEAALTHDGTLLGTPAYMAPEQARRELTAIGPRSDVYSLGVILYELLSGRPPFRGEVLQVLGQVLSAPPPPPSTHRPNLDRRLEAICLKAMAKRPEDRYGSMADFAAALADYVRSVPESPATAETPFEPINSPDPPPEQKLQPRARRGSPDPAEAPDRQVSSPGKRPQPRPAPRAVPRSAPSSTAPDDGPSIVLAIPPEPAPQPESEPPQTVAPARHTSPKRERGSRLPPPLARRARATQSGRWQQIPPVWKWLAVSLAAFALLCLGIILLVSTPHGTVKIELSDRQAQVQVKVDGDTIDLAGLDQPLRLRVGAHGVVVTGKDFETVTESFTVKRGTEVPVRITLVPKVGQAFQPDGPDSQPGKADVRTAVYHVQLAPAGAKLLVSGAGATVVAQDDQWTVTVAHPDGQQEIELVATKSGYESQEQKVRPRAGESRTLAIQLNPVPPPKPVEPPAPQSAVFQVQIEPADARLVVSGEGASVVGQGAKRTVTVAQPDGKKKIALLASKAGFRSDERELQPAAGESRSLTFHLLSATAPRPGTSQPGKADLQNSLGTKFVLIQPGEFLMGSPDSDSEADSSEKPQHRVKITKPFYLGMYEVTQAEYQQVMGTNPSNFKASGETAPVDSVSWEDAQEFCVKLSALSAEQAAGRRYRLPTEAEWEYACRAGTTSRYGFYESSESLGGYAWYDKNSGSKTHPVGEKKPNAWGLYDMQGNVYEWCHDWHEEKYYGQFKSEPAVDPHGPQGGVIRVLRGGCWNRVAQDCRLAARSGLIPGIRHIGRGFRLALGRSQ